MASGGGAGNGISSMQAYLKKILVEQFIEEFFLTHNCYLFKSLQKKFLDVASTI